MRNLHSRVSAAKWRFMVKRGEWRRQKLTANKRTQQLSEREKRRASEGNISGEHSLSLSVTEAGALIWHAIAAVCYGGYAKNTAAISLSHTHTSVELMHSSLLTHTHKHVLSCTSIPTGESLKHLSVCLYIQIRLKNKYYSARMH